MAMMGGMIVSTTNGPPSEADEQGDPPGTEEGRGKAERVSISIRFDLALYRELRRLGEAEHRSFNGTVNEACKRYVRQRRPRLEREGDGEAK